MPYGQTHTETIPTVSVTVGPTYAAGVNACLEEIRATLDAKVTPAGFDVNAALSFLSGGTNYPVTNLERANFQNKGAAISASVYPNALYVVNGDLYYNDNSGNQVRIINAGALNISATGGITGSGYGSGSVEVNWSAGDSAYKLKSGASSYASAWMNDLYLNDGDTNFVRITAQAMGADYALTLPAALPGSTQILQVSSSGTVSASNTVANPVTFSGSITGNDGLSISAGGSVDLTSDEIHLNGPAYLAQRLVVEGVISPAALSGNTDNWNPTGLSTAAIIRMSASAAYDLTGIVPTETGQRLDLVNVGAFNITLKEDTTSTATNRFYLPGSSDVVINPRGAITIWYDGTSSRWRALGRT